jgi:Tol biopolymer transport system component
MLPFSSRATPWRRLHPGLLALAAALALGACGTEDSFAPTDGTTAAADHSPDADAGSAAVATPAPATVGMARILFTSYRTGTSNLYSMDPSGANVFALSKGYTHDMEPSWSWDHKQIAVIRPRWTGSFNSFDVYVINADGTNGHWARPYAVASYGFREPSWSPDGSRILVRVEIQYTPNKYLGWIDVATGAVKFFNPAIEGSAPSYDKAGKRIVYVGKNDKTIEQINADGTGHKVRFSSTTDWSVLHPSFSPDGTKILFERILSNFNREIYVKNLIGGTLQRLTYNSADDGNATWSPDGTQIAFASDRSKPTIPRQYQIYVMSSTGTNVYRIKTDSTDWSPAWSH